jgi:peptide-methionine (S)-S-oxide reductase
MSETAILAAGCFWGVEETLRKTAGVLSTEVGYIGGAVQNPDYKLVCSNTTGHAEAVRLDFDPAVLSYEALLGLFFELHDPTQVNRQGPDVGTQYRSAIFPTTAEQGETAAAVIAALAESGKFAKPIATVIEASAPFYPAEDYHQKYIAKKRGEL